MKRKQEKHYQFPYSRGGCYTTDGRYIECLHKSEWAYVSHTCLHIS